MKGGLMPILKTEAQMLEQGQGPGILSFDLRMDPGISSGNKGFAKGFLQGVFAMAFSPKLLFPYGKHNLMVRLIWGELDKTDGFLMKADEIERTLCIEDLCVEGYI